MEDNKCHICGKTKKNLGEKETLGSLEYKHGMNVNLCSICHGIIEKISESVVRSHLSDSLDSHQELSEYIRTIVESYLYQDSEKHY